MRNLCLEQVHLNYRDMKSSQQSEQRNRARILMPEALQRVEDEIEKKFLYKSFPKIYQGLSGNRYNYTELQKQITKHCNPLFSLSPDTLKKILCGIGTDETSINEVFKALKLKEPKQGIDYDYASKITSSKSDISENKINSLVRKTREKIRGRIQRDCGTIKVLQMTQPLNLTGDDGIYTNLKIRRKITRNRRSSVDDLLQGIDLESFDRPNLGEVIEEQVSGLDVVKQHFKLVIWGQPGAGKTTFLKYLAVQCSDDRNNFQEDRVPIFITLRDFAEAPKRPNLLEYIKGQLLEREIQEEQTTSLILEGKGLILLDGLDEVRDKDASRVITQVQSFADRYYTNQFVITCRFAAQEYTFQNFNDVEVADFDDRQINTFAQKWFQGKERGKEDKFIKKLNENKPIKELATNPLLLTLLCLVFEELTDFPVNRAYLYEQGIDVLLKKWDITRKIERDEVYKGLTLKRKEDLLSRIAEVTFKKKELFFRKNELEQHVFEYIHNLPDAQTDREALRLDSEAVVKSIEAQHGLLVERAQRIYSFSHLTFHEYFTARQIKETSSPEVLQDLVSHLTEARWQEVFLLTAGMMQNADSLIELMKEKIDETVIDKKLQYLLEWVNRKATHAKEVEGVTRKPSAVRAFYLVRIRECASAHRIISNQIFGLDADLDQANRLDRTLALDRVLLRARAFALDPSLVNRHCIGELNSACELTLSDELKLILQKLIDQLPDPKSDLESVHQWWQNMGQAWAEELRKAMVQYRDIDHDWQFDQAQKKRLKQYYEANVLLVKCLKAANYTTRAVRERIEDSLLLP